MESVGMIFICLAYVLAAVIGIVLVALTIRFLWIVPNTMKGILDALHPETKEEVMPKQNEILYDPNANEKAQKEYAKILDDCTTLQ